MKVLRKPHRVPTYMENGKRPDSERDMVMIENKEKELDIIIKGNRKYSLDLIDLKYEAALVLLESLYDDFKRLEHEMEEEHQGILNALKMRYTISFDMMIEKELHKVFGK